MNDRKCPLCGDAGTMMSVTVKVDGITFCEDCGERRHLVAALVGRVRELESQLADTEAMLATEKEVTKYLAASIMERNKKGCPIDLRTSLSLAGWEIVNTGKAGKHTWHSIKKKEADDES